MSSLSKTLVEVVDREIAQQKRITDQEIRVSIFLFGVGCDCLLFDTDISRVPSIGSFYTANDGRTELVDSTIKVIQDLRKIPELYGDHSHLVNIITDGEDNQCRSKPGELKRLLDLLPENWTISCSVPNSRALYTAKLLGFSPGNLNIWRTDEEGLKELGTERLASVTNFYTQRSAGVRGTKTFYQPDVGTLNVASLTNVKLLEEIPFLSYLLNVVPDTTNIRDFVEESIQRDRSVTSPFGLTPVVQYHQQYDQFYRLSKTETVQASKRILVYNNAIGKLYDDARRVLGLPGGDSIKVSPGNHGDWDIYVQSTSVNRKLVSGDRVIIMARK